MCMLTDQAHSNHARPAEDEYLSFSDRVFQKKRHRVSITGGIQGRFDSEELERAVKEVIKQQGLQEDVLLKDAPDAACKV
jgi:hypothetical protein